MLVRDNIKLVQHGFWIGTSLLDSSHDNILFIGDRVKYIGTIAPPGFALQTPLRSLSLSLPIYMV